MISSLAIECKVRGIFLEQRMQGLVSTSMDFSYPSTFASLVNVSSLFTLWNAVDVSFLY